jgi:hypothetical protein
MIADSQSHTGTNLTNTTEQEAPESKPSETRALRERKKRMMGGMITEIEVRVIRRQRLEELTYSLIMFSRGDSLQACAFR